MYKKITLRQRFLQTGLLMLLLSLIIGVGLSVTLLVLFPPTTPRGRSSSIPFCSYWQASWRAPAGCCPISSWG